jgi:ricin-type beta-trefoil lectin protein
MFTRDRWRRALAITAMMCSLVLADSAAAVAAEPAGTEQAGADQAAAAQERASQLAPGELDEPAPATDGISPRPAPGGSNFRLAGQAGPGIAQTGGCNVGFNRNIQQFPGILGSVSVNVNFSSTLACSGDVIFDGEAWLVNVSPGTAGQLLAIAPRIQGTGTRTSAGSLFIPAAFNGGEQLETLLVVGLFSPIAVWDSCNSSPGVRVLVCAGLGTTTLTAVLGSGAYATGKRPLPALPPPTPLPVGTYTISAVHSGSCLDVAGAGTADGDNIHQWTCIGGPTGGNPNQRWRIVPQGDGSNDVIATHSNKCLDVAGAGTNDGANVHQWTCVGGANQRWVFFEVAPGQFTIVAVHSGKCLDVAGAGTADGTNIQQWTCIGGPTGGGANQRWRLTRVA